MDKIILYKDGLSADDPEEAVRRMSLLLDELEAGSYKPGARNNIAVDLAILCWELDLDPVTDIAKLFLDEDDIDDLEERLEVINDYLEYWDRYNIESYMLGDYGDNPKKEWIVLQ